MHAPRKFIFLADFIKKTQKNKTKQKKLDFSF